MTDSTSSKFVYGGIESVADFCDEPFSRRKSITLQRVRSSIILLEIFYMF